MYSPLARPSRIRAAPAKNRIWSTIGGISSEAVTAMDLPVFSLSRAISSSAFASTMSAIFSRAACRSDGVVWLQVSKASDAALYARSTSSALDTTAWANTSPVVGLTRSLVWPETESTDSPLTKLRMVRLTGSPLSAGSSDGQDRHGGERGATRPRV
jgi:hypothetical protein